MVLVDFFTLFCREVHGHNILLTSHYVHACSHTSHYYTCCYGNGCKYSVHMWLTMLISPKLSLPPTAGDIKASYHQTSRVWLYLRSYTKLPPCHKTGHSRSPTTADHNNRVYKVHYRTHQSLYNTSCAAKLLPVVCAQIQLRYHTTAYSMLHAGKKFSKLFIWSPGAANFIINILGL